MLKVLLFGHSYVRDLCQLRSSVREFVLQKSQTEIKLFYKYFPGRDFKYFLDHPGELESISNVEPDFIFVILGGNTIVNELDNPTIKWYCRDFYVLLKQYIPSSCKIIASEVELRFCLGNNRFNAPTEETFQRKRRNLIFFIKNKLKKRGIVDHMFFLGGTGGLMLAEYFKADGVHLNIQGLTKLQHMIKRMIRYAVEGSE